MKFGQRLQRARADTGMTQDDLGKGLGSHGKDAGKQVVLGWEKGRHFPKVDQLTLICERLKCSADYLLFGTAAGAAWPFSAEMWEAVEKLLPSARGTLENVMRAHLGMNQLPAQDALAAAAQTMDNMEAFTKEKSQPRDEIAKGGR